MKKKKKKGKKREKKGKRIILFYFILFYFPTATYSVVKVTLNPPNILVNSNNSNNSYYRYFQLNSKCTCEPWGLPVWNGTANGDNPDSVFPHNLTLTVAKTILHKIDH